MQTEVLIILNKTEAGVNSGAWAQDTRFSNKKTETSWADPQIQHEYLAIHSSYLDASIIFLPKRKIRDVTGKVIHYFKKYLRRHHIPTFVKERSIANFYEFQMLILFEDMTLFYMID